MQIPKKIRIASDLAEALGLPVTNCLGFTLVAHSDGTVTLRAEYFVMDAQADSLLTFANEFTLVPKAGTVPGAVGTTIPETLPPCQTQTTPK